MHSTSLSVRTAAWAWLLGACALAPTPHEESRPWAPATDSQVIADAFTKAVDAFRPVERMMLVAAQPRPAQVLGNGKLNVTVLGHLSAGQARDGSWLVQVPANGSGATGQGRKALVVVCGHLLDIAPFADPTTHIGTRFQEDGYFQSAPSAWWFGGNWIAGWRFQVPPPFDGSQLANPPATWGPVNAPLHDSWAWMVAGYLPQVVGAQIGTVLAMHLMQRQDEMGLGLMRLAQQWKVGPPASANAQLLAVGIALPWGNDYALVRGAGFCAAAWLAIAPLWL